MVVVDKLRKVAHFITVKYTYKEIDIHHFFYEGDINIAWYTQEDHLRSRWKIYLEILESIVCWFWERVSF